MCRRDRRLRRLRRSWGWLQRVGWRGRKAGGLLTRPRRLVRAGLWVRGGRRQRRRLNQLRRLKRRWLSQPRRLLLLRPLRHQGLQLSMLRLLQQYLLRVLLLLLRVRL